MATHGRSTKGQRPGSTRQPNGSKSPKQGKTGKDVTQTLMVGLFTIAIVGYGFFMNFQAKNVLEEREAELKAMVTTLSEMEGELNTKAVQNEQKERAVIKESTGFDKDLILLDTQEAENFFKPAFNWTNGDEYNFVREQYVEALGADSQFTTTFLPEPLTIDVGEEKELSYIDHKELKSAYDGILLIPTAYKGDTVEYTAFIRYYPYQRKKDLVRRDRLMNSDAIVTFTVSGDASKGERDISNVEALPGFATTSNR